MEGGRGFKKWPNLHCVINEQPLRLLYFIVYLQNTNGENEAECTVNEIPRSKILAKIQEISDYKKPIEHGLAFNRICWAVKPEILEKFSLTTLEIPNTWEYILEIPTKNSVSGTPSATATPSAAEGNGNGDPTCDTPKSDRPAPSASGSSFKGKVAPSSLITKFTKVLSEEERQSQLLSSKPAPASTPAPSALPSEGPSGSTPAKAKKRIQPTLIAMTAAMASKSQSQATTEKPKE